MPVFTAAPLPLLYGWRITRAPAASARCAVASLEPSSTTMISRPAAPSRRLPTTAAMDSSSFIAGMTIDTSAGSAKELLHHAVPRHGQRARPSRRTEAGGKRRVGRQAREGGADRRRLGVADEAVDPVGDELERAAGIGGGDDGLAAEERFERHVAVVLVEGDVDHRAGAGVELDERVRRRRAGE